LYSDKEVSNLILGKTIYGARKISNVIFLKRSPTCKAAKNCGAQRSRATSSFPGIVCVGFLVHEILFRVGLLGCIL